MTRAIATRIVAAIVWWLLAPVSLALAQDSQPQHQHAEPAPQPTPADPEPHQHDAQDGKQSVLPASIPLLTDEDRRAAFPDVRGHAVHDNALNYFVLFDQLEWQAAEGASGIDVDSRGWLGNDLDRFWLRAEGDTESGHAGQLHTHLLYGRRVSRWWDVVAGVRQDFRPGSPQTWAAVGVQGLAPYWFEIEATAYVGGSGRTQARFEVEYELLLTNRLIVQPLFETEIVGKSDPERGIGRGVSTTDLGFRLRYEFRREIAPYVGVTWSNKWGQTADFAESAGEDRGGARFVTGLRVWF